jgi:hypothetical protein
MLEKRIRGFLLSKNLFSANSSNCCALDIKSCVSYNCLSDYPIEIKSGYRTASIGKLVRNGGIFMAQINIPFKDNKDDTITDASSGLMWQKSPDRDAAMGWDEACKFVQTLSTGGKSGWRLPTKQELLDLAHTAGENPSQWLCDHGFEGIDWEFYWTSSKHEKKPDYFWYVDMGTGECGIHPKDKIYFVWAVRKNDAT